MEIKTLIQKFEKVVISHTYHEANGVANQIANCVVQMGHKVSWHEELNKNVDLKAIINYEAIHSEVGKICLDQQFNDLVEWPYGCQITFPEEVHSCECNVVTIRSF